MECNRRENGRTKKQRGKQKYGEKVEIKREDRVETGQKWKNNVAGVEGEKCVARKVF